MVHVKRFVVGLVLVIGSFCLLILGGTGVAILWQYLKSITSAQVHTVFSWFFLILVALILLLGLGIVAYESGTEFLEKRKK